MPYFFFFFLISCVTVLFHKNCVQLTFCWKYNRCSWTPPSPKFIRKFNICCICSLFSDFKVKVYNIIAANKWNLINFCHSRQKYLTEYANKLLEFKPKAQRIDQNFIHYKSKVERKNSV